MIKITENQIRGIATNWNVYERGIRLVDRVYDYIFDKNRNIAYATVAGTYDYDVIVKFNDSGRIEDYQCQCVAYSSYEGACKHVVALLKVLKDNQKNYPMAEKSDPYLPFNFIQPGKKENMARLWLDHAFKNQGQVGAYLNLRLRAGLLKPYVVRDIPAFLEAVESEKNMIFTKKFDLDFNKTYFEGIDKRIIDFLIELYNKEKLYNEFVRPEHSFYSQNVSIFEKDSVMLFEDNLKHYLEIIKHQHATVIDNDNKFTGIQIKDDLTVDVKINEKDNALLMEANYSTNVKVMALTNDFEYVLDPFTSAVYKIPEAVAPLVEQIHHARLKKVEPIFKINKSQQVGFIKDFLPKIQQSCHVEINPDLQTRIDESLLVIKIYFDVYGKGISAKVNFCYGDRIVNPGGSENDLGVVIRDMEKEDWVVDFLKSIGMIFKKGQFVLEDDEAIVHLLSEKIEEVKEYGEIYYSESFKAMKIKNVNKVQMGLRLNIDTSLLEFDFKADDIGDDELIKLIHSVKEKKKYFRLKSGSFINLDNKGLVNLAELLGDLDIDERKLETSSVRIPSNRALFIDNFVKDKGIEEIKKDKKYEHLVEEILNPTYLDVKVDERLEDVLRDYQKIGFKWMKTLAHYGFGGILADDMGLGKTLQVLAFIKSELQTLDRPSLVVAPTSLVYNWRAEVEKFVPELKVNVISGTKAERIKQLALIPQCDIAVTSYGSLKRDIDDYEKMEFSYVFIDEAQHIKNPATLNAGSVKSLKAKGYFALTGTPIENALTELWSIFDFIMPGYLMNHHKFITKFESPIVRDNDKIALKTLSRYIKPFILRRLKKDVLKELPDKIESKVISDMTAEQRKLYLAYLKKAQGEIAAEISEKGVEQSKLKILAALTRLRQLCCHPATFIDGYRGGSGKLEMLLQILTDSIESGHRILIFSQFTSMLEIIQHDLNTLNIPYFYLDGSTKAQDRMDMVQRFNSLERPIFLISLKAGGTGLNLTGADVVIHFDPWWNPSVEDQATDRAYRIGQTRAVQVFKIVTKGTIEEKIIELQDKKRGLINSIIQPGENLLTKLSEEDIRALFQLQK